MLKFTMGGVPVEIWFTPSFNIKTTDKRIELMLRNQSIETYDPVRKTIRPVRASRSLHDAFLMIEEYKVRVPELNIEYTETPEFKTSVAEPEGTTDSPITD
jgi:hypothetical protein